MKSFECLSRRNFSTGKGLPFRQSCSWRLRALWGLLNPAHWSYRILVGFAFTKRFNDWFGSWNTYKKKASTMATTAKWLLHIQRQLCAQLIQKNTHVYRTNMGIRMHEKINNKKSEWIKMWYIGTGVNVSSTILISIPIMSHDWKLEIFPIRTWFHIHFVVVVVSF